MVEQCNRLLFLCGVLLCYTVYEVAGQTCSRVTTFNTGLTPVVATVNGRQEVIERAIQQTDSDVMCLQEVWFESSLEALIKAGYGQFPHHFSALHRRANQLNKPSANSWLSWLIPDSPCSGSELSYIIQTIASCGVSNLCVGRDPHKIASCFAENCKAELKSSQVSQSCLSCMTFSLSSIREVVSKCGNVEGSDKIRFNGPGLLLLSKRPISWARYVNYHPGRKMFVQRGYIEAQIEGVGKVVCTHLSAQFEHYMEFDTPYKSDLEQQSAEIEVLGRLASRGGNHILMGDLNTGPSMTFFTDPTRKVTGAAPENYKRMLSFGYRSPYVSQVKLCTYCRTNRFTKGDESYILDHVMLKGSSYGGIVARRTFMSQDQQAMSDHFGVEVRVCPLDAKTSTRSSRTSRGGIFQRFLRFGTNLIN